MNDKNDCPFKEMIERNQKDICDLTNEIKNLTKGQTKIETLFSYIMTSMDKMQGQLEFLTSAGNRKWDKLVWIIIGAVVGILSGVIAGGL